MFNIKLLLKNLINQTSRNKLRIKNIPIEYILPNPYQPRRDYKEEELKDLITSIDTHGIIQPIILRRLRKCEYEIVCGERRYRAAKALGLQTIPAIVGNFTDLEMLQIALLENIHRKDLTQLEEAQGFSSLSKMIKEENVEEEAPEGINSKSNIEYISRLLSKSVQEIEEKLQLLLLPPLLKEAMNMNLINEEQAKLLTTLKEENDQLFIIDRIKKENLNTQQVKELIDSMKEQSLLKEDEKEKQKRIILALILLENLVNALKVSGLDIEYEKNELSPAQLEVKLKFK